MLEYRCHPGDDMEKFILSKEEFYEKYTKNGKARLIDFETDREAYCDWSIQIALSTRFSAMGDPSAKFEAESIIHVMVEELEAMGKN